MSCQRSTQRRLASVSVVEPLFDFPSPQGYVWLPTRFKLHLQRSESLEEVGSPRDMDRHTTSDAVVGGRGGTDGPVRTDKEREKDRPSPRASPYGWQPSSDPTAMPMMTFGGPDLGSEFYRSVPVVSYLQCFAFDAAITLTVTPVATLTPLQPQIPCQCQHSGCNSCANFACCFPDHV